MSKLTIYQRGGSDPHPHLWIEPRSLLNIRFAVFEGMVRYDANLNIVPLLAESWTVSEDGEADWFCARLARVSELHSRYAPAMQTAKNTSTATSMKIFR